MNSSGHLELRDAKLKAIWPYVRDSVPIELEDGVLEVATDYRLALGKTVQLNLEQLNVTLNTLALQAPDQRPLLNLASLAISDTSVDLAKQQVVIGQLRSQQLETWAAREKDGQLDWQKLLATPAMRNERRHSSNRCRLVPPLLRLSAPAVTGAPASTEPPAPAPH